MTHNPVMERPRTKAGTRKLEAASLTRQGSQRAINQDALFERVGQAGPIQDVGLFIVCDGLGGLAQGEVASQLAIDSVTASLSGVFTLRATPAPTSTFSQNWIRDAVSDANTEIREYARAHAIEPGQLATTITLALVDGRAAYIANVGDSRAYALRNEEITRITEDHSLVMKLAKDGMIPEVEAYGDPRRNVLLRALGRDDRVKTDVFEWPHEPGDKLLLCSDGLWAAFPDESDLKDILSARLPPADICRRLAAEAMRRGGSDDLSAIVVNLI